MQSNLLAGVFAVLYVGSHGLTVAVAEDLAARREQVQKLPASEQQQLLRNQDRFLALSTDEQDQLRKLDAELTKDPQEAKLRATLERYHEWLKTLRPEQRAELAELGPDERIVRIRQLVERQQEEQKRLRQRFAGGAPPLPNADVPVISKWFGDIVWEHREELLASMPPERREQFEKQDGQTLRRSLMFVAFQRWRRQPIPVTPQQVEQLVKSLSVETQERIKKMDEPQRERLSRDLVWQAMASRMGSPQRRRGMALASNEDMEHFFEHELPEEDRQRLMNLPREQMRDELNSRYFRHLRETTDRPPGRPPGPPYGRGDRPRRPPGEGRGPGGPGRSRDDFPPGGFPPPERDRDRGRPSYEGDRDRPAKIRPDNQPQPR